MRVALESHSECRARRGHLREGGGKRWAEQGGQNAHLPDLAVGSSDHPVRADERTTTEVEAILVLGARVRKVGRPKPQ